METSVSVPIAHVMDLLLDAVCVVDLRGRFVFVSAACNHIFGYSAEEMIGQPMIDFVYAPDRESTLASAAKVIAGEAQPHFENRYLHKNGEVVHIMWSARWSEPDQARIAVARDVTARKRAEAKQASLYAISEAAHTAEDLLALFERVHEIVGDLLPAANFFVALYDREKDELSFPYHVDEHDSRPAPFKLDAGSLSAEVVRTGKALLVTPDTCDVDAARLVPVVGTPSLDWLGVPLISQTGVIGALVVQSYSGVIRYTATDQALLQFVSTQVATAIERKQSESRLHHLARHDPLSDLPNRAHFHELLQAALNRAHDSRAEVGLLYIDLDQFKQVNDLYGHAVGDLLLYAVGRRIQACLRATDSVSRIGGDEFVVLLADLSLPEHAAAVAEKICHGLHQPFDLAGQLLTISASIGIAIHSDHGQAAHLLMRLADDAMYTAKRAGGNRAFSGDGENR